VGILEHKVLVGIRSEQILPGDVSLWNLTTPRTIFLFLESSDLKLNYGYMFFSRGA
jgi:hypothetical protein